MSDGAETEGDDEFDGSGLAGGRVSRPREALIIYSLGNFFADQIGMEVPIPKTQYGMLVSLVIKRDAAGDISLREAQYMPTFCYRDSMRVGSGTTGFGYVFAPAGKYAKMEDVPEGMSARSWEEARKAWEHVRGVVGDEIEAYDGN